MQPWNSAYLGGHQSSSNIAADPDGPKVSGVIINSVTRTGNGNVELFPICSAQQGPNADEFPSTTRFLFRQKNPSTWTDFCRED